MAFQFKVFSQAEEHKAFDYWRDHTDASFCHQPEWWKVFSEAYGRNCRCYGVFASDGAVAGVGVLVFLRGPLSGRIAVGLPYLDYGGPLSDNPEAEKTLVEGMLQAAGQENSALELRSSKPLSFLSSPNNSKVSMKLPLEGKTFETWWKSLDAKVRNQVRKAEKSEVTLRVGQADRLDEFYEVFCENMRDLGSPVHSRPFLLETVQRVPGMEIVTAHRAGRCVGGLVRLRKGDTLAIPWASTLRAERIYCPNNALYHDAIRFAFERGLKQVDFGRSTRDEGTYKFKKQWLAEEQPLYWYQFDSRGNLKTSVAHAASSKLEFAAKLWAKLPVGLASVLGAKIRPFIPA